MNQPSIMLHGVIPENSTGITLEYGVASQDFEAGDQVLLDKITILPYDHILIDPLNYKMGFIRSTTVAGETALVDVFFRYRSPHYFEKLIIQQDGITKWVYNAREEVIVNLITPTTIEHADNADHALIADIANETVGTLTVMSGTETLGVFNGSEDVIVLVPQGGGTIKTLTGTKDGAALFSFDGTTDTTVAFDTPTFVENAGHATNADHADYSDKAGAANTAANADHSRYAESAEVALALQNTLTINQNGTQLGTFDGSADTVVDITTSGGGGGQTPVTFAELLNTINTGALVPGSQYLLTDYATKYQQPGTNVIKTCPIEPLVLTATGPYSVSPICLSTSYTKDIVYYSTLHRTCEDGVTPRNGFIMRRIDTEYSIDMPHDWRNMLWARFKATAPVWTSGAVVRRTMYQSGTDLYLAIKAGTPTSATDAAFFQKVCSVNDYYWTQLALFTGLTLNTVDYAERYTFNASLDLTLKMPTAWSSYSPRAITVGAANTSSSLLVYGFTNNVWNFAGSSYPYRITLGEGCQQNTFMGAGYNITFGNNCTNNIITNSPGINFGNIVQQNVFVSNSPQNTLLNFIWGTVLFGCDNNQFGPNANENILLSGCTGNTFATISSRSTLGSSSMYNNFAPSTSVITNLNFSYNTVLTGFGNADVSAIPELHNKMYTHQLFINSTNNKRALHWVNNTPTYTTIT